MSTPLIEECLPVLERTPAVLNAMLRGLPVQWTTATEGPGTWSPYDVVGHLLHGEQTDWMTRLEIILEYGPDRPFDPFDREAQLRDSADRSLESLLDSFAAARSGNLSRLAALDLQPAHLALQGTHPVLGRVTAGSLIATWATHDLAHILQISRVMAKRMKPEVGPWAQFLSVMRDPPDGAS
jgi:hypothetical protein